MNFLSRINFTVAGLIVAGGALDSLVGYLDGNNALLGGATVVVTLGVRQIDKWVHERADASAPAPAPEVKPGA